MSVTIIINPISGGARRVAMSARLALVKRIAETQGETWDVFVTERRGHARELADRAVERGARLVVAWGGDGTINEVVCALAFEGVPLGIIPAGSGNGLARELGIALDPSTALLDAVRAQPRAIDVGELGGRLFVNVAGIGLDAEVADRFNAAANQRRGLTGYVLLASRMLLGYAPADYAITTAGVSMSARAILVTIANSAQFGNDARIAPCAKVDDGELDLVVIEERHRLRTLCHLPRLFNGTIARMPGCTSRRITEATIECERPMIFHVDGEPARGGTELHARVHPGALQICVK